MESTTYPELSEFVSRAEERRDLFMFFRSLHCFVEWCEYRKRTFKHFKEKYPEAVHLSEGASSSHMGIRSASRPGFELVIVWRVHIDAEGKVLPKLDLLTQVPQRGRPGRVRSLMCPRPLIPPGSTWEDSEVGNLIVFFITCANILISNHSRSTCWSVCVHGHTQGPVGEQGWVPMMFLTQSVFLAALELDEKGVIEMAPASFRVLLGVLGIEVALESLLRVVCTEAEPMLPNRAAQEAGAAPGGV
ncbi:centromere protein P isoform 2-T2 [Molossus nigricans]